MGNLRDQLKKANLLSKKEARRLEHEERIRKKELGREGLEQEAQQRAAELERIRAQEREKTHQVQAELDQARRAREELAACEAILAHETRTPARGGRGGRWHFELSDGRLPSLTLAEIDRHQLQNGQLCVVRIGPSGTHGYGLLPAALAKRVQAALPDRVVWSAGGGAQGAKRGDDAGSPAGDRG